MRLSVHLGLLAVSCPVLAGAADAQFNNTWAAFVKDPNRIRNPDGSMATQVTTDPDEKDYAWGDLDRDGWIDLVVVRKQPAHGLGKRPNQLLMNENGVLVDRTSQLAADSSVPGDFGFLTPTNDLDSQIVDVDGDQWPDVVTAVTLSDGDPKHISHPRVYRNKGAIGGVWQGLRYEEARIPQILDFATGLPLAPHFGSVSAGDVTGDGFPDLYFADFNGSTGTAGSGPGVDDRLLVNTGAGVFVDSLQTLMTSAMLVTATSLDSKIIDMNGDGALDVVRHVPWVGSGAGFTIAYNIPGTSGVFGILQSFFPTAAPYHVDVGDLNRDGRPDLVLGDDGADKMRFHLGNLSNGAASLGLARPFQFVTGGDDGFVGRIHIADLDDDSWPETIHADVDAEVPGCGRYCHIYHNLGGTIGSEVILRHEAESPLASGWRGAVGLTIAELQGTFDVAIFDLDRDGDLDLLLGRCSGTSVWLNQKDLQGMVVCSGDGSGTGCPCGNGSALAQGEGCVSSLGQAGRLRPIGHARLSADDYTLISTQVPNGPALYLQGTSIAAGGAGIVFGDGLLCCTGAVTRLGVVFASGNTSRYPRLGVDPAISYVSLLAPGDVRTYQAWYRDSNLGYCTSSTFNLTNAITVAWQN